MATLNLASGRGADGVPRDADGLRAGLAELAAHGVDVLSLQEVDVGQPRSGGLDQGREAAAALGAGDWRFAPTLAGTPGPFVTWRRLPASLLGGALPGDDVPDDASSGPLFGNALLTTRPVRAWHALDLGTGRGRLPLRGPDPRTGAVRTWWFPDEPRVALAAELDGVTVVGTHLSFAPVTALRQLRALRRWVTELPGPVALAGDLNLPGAVPARVLGARELVRAATFPGASPRLQLDHVVGWGVTARSGEALSLGVGDHRALVVELDVP